MILGIKAGGIIGLKDQSGTEMISLIIKYMRYRSNIYELTQSARYIFAVLLMLCPVSIFASSVNTIDTFSIVKSLGDVVNRVISETESGIDLWTGTIFGDGNCIRNNPSISYRVPVPITCPSKEANNTTHPHAVAEVENGLKAWYSLIGMD